MGRRFTPEKLTTTQRIALGAWMQANGIDLDNVPNDLPIDVAHIMGMITYYERRPTVRPDDAETVRRSIPIRVDIPAALLAASEPSPPNLPPSWPNTGQQQPTPDEPSYPVDVAGRNVAAQHAAVLAVAKNLDAGDDTEPAMHARQKAGKLRTLHRHAPVSDAPNAAADCNTCRPHTKLGGLTVPWPCDDYCDAVDGLVTGLGA